MKFLLFHKLYFSMNFDLQGCFHILNMKGLTDDPQDQGMAFCSYLEFI